MLKVWSALYAASAQGYSPASARVVVVVVLVSMYHLLYIQVIYYNQNTLSAFNDSPVVTTLILNVFLIKRRGSTS